MLDNLLARRLADTDAPHPSVPRGAAHPDPDDPVAGTPPPPDGVPWAPGHGPEG